MSVRASERLPTQFGRTRASSNDLRQVPEVMCDAHQELTPPPELPQACQPLEVVRAGPRHHPLAGVLGQAGLSSACNTRQGGRVAEARS
jgi:hypothetical protein